MEFNTGIIAAVSGLIGALGGYFSTNKKTKADADVGYGKAILDSHTAVWEQVNALRRELKEERQQNLDLSEQLQKALNKIDEVLDEKRELVEQMTTLNDRVQSLENENRNLQDKVDRLTTELERTRTQSE